MQTPRRIFAAAVAAVTAAAVGLAAVGAAAAAATAKAEPDPKEAVNMLSQFAAIPSNSKNAKGVRQAADWLTSAFVSAGLKARRIEIAGPNPLVYAEHAPEGATRTVLFYLHYDTQPTGPPDDWASTGGDPFKPRLLSGRFDEPEVRPIEIADLDATLMKTARLYARGVADDKAPIVMHLMGLKRWLAGPQSKKLRVRYLLDGEEEAGSPNFAAGLRELGEMLRADLVVLCDGPMDALGRPSVYLGTRGDMHMRLRVTTAESSAHSGNYGLLPDAAGRLASILATMKDPNGTVTVDGFEDGVIPPTADEKAAMKVASSAEAAITEHLGAPQLVGDPSIPYFERLLFHPTLIFNHVDAGRPGNQIPNTAEALIEVRLVTAQDPQRVFEVFKQHVAKQMPEAELTLLDGGRAARMDPRDPAVAKGLAAIRTAAGGDLLVYPTLGGTLPLLHDLETAGFKYIGLPLVNFDNNQHVANENLKVEVLPRGILFVQRLLDALASP